MSELWYPQATRRSGPEWKQGYSDTPERRGKGGIFHSAEGPLSVMLSILDGPAKKSWTLSNPKVGSLLQHYPLKAVTWHAGAKANKLYFGVEHEGMADDPLTESQVENDLGLLRWAGQVEDWPEFSRASTLREHNEFMATACPSGRIPWDRLIDALNVQNTASLDETAWLRARLGLAHLLTDKDNPDAFQQTADVLAGWLGVRPKV